MKSHNGESSPRQRNPRGEGHVLRAQLVEAAGRLLATVEQPEKLTLRQIAREVGVAPASIYSHFPDLSALIQHVLRMRYAELADQMSDAATHAIPGPLPDLVARCAAYVRWAAERPGDYRSLFGTHMPADLVPPATHGAGADLLRSVTDSLAAVTDLQAMASDTRRWQAGLLLWTALHGLVSLYNDHGDLAWPPLEDLLADTLSLHTGHQAADIAALLDSPG